MHNDDLPSNHDRSERFSLAQPLFPAALCLFVFTALVAGSTWAQQATRPDLEFTESIDVELINVDVWVTDRSGGLATGLTAEDFELLEDGEPVEIEFFSEVQGSAPVVSSIERRLAGETPPSPKPDALATALNHLIVYFDEMHLQPSSRHRALDNIAQFLSTEEVPPERVLILAQDRQLRTVATFGSSWLVLEEELEKLGKELPEGGLMGSEKRLALRELQELWTWASSVAQGDSPDAACEVYRPRAVPVVENYAENSRERIGQTLEHLASTAAFLNGVPGVKTLLFVSDALERAPGTDLMRFIDDLCPIHQQTSMFLLSDELGQAFRRLTRHANANRVVIYTLQGTGLMTGFTQGAQQRGGVGFRSSTSFDTAKRTSEREGMSTLAVETGGRAIFDRNNFAEELRAVAREMSNYYSLAYVPLHDGDGGDHGIEVRIKRDGMKVRHRKGYRDKSADEQMTERLQGAVYLGLVDNPLGVRLGAGDVAAAEKKRLRVPLHIVVPSEKVTFLPTDEGVIAQISVQVSTRNTRDQRGIFDHRAYRVHWKTPEDQESVVVSIDLEMPSGLHIVAVAVRDDATRTTSYVSTSIQLEPQRSGP